MISRMKISVVVGFLAVVAGSEAGFAQPVKGVDPNAGRPVLERQFHERLARLAQTRIGLTDAQMTQLEQSTSRYAPQLNKLAADERETRRQLRVELTSPQPNQQHVGQLLDTSVQLQKQRVALVEAEQKDLARFMTPVQRARYIALQQQFRRRTQELSGQRAEKRAEKAAAKKLP